jgi:signal transduction histidine kinase
VWPVANARRDRNEILLQAGLALASERSLEAVLEQIVELARTVTSAKYGAIGILDSDGRFREFVAVGFTAEQWEAIGHTPVGRGVLGALVDDPRPLRLPVLQDDPRSVGFPPHHPHMTSFLGAPVRIRDRVFGNIYVTEKRDADAFDEDDERDLVWLAAQAAVAVENARLHEQARSRERRLEAIREIGEAILHGEEPERALVLVATRARELGEADLAAIAVPEGSALIVSVAVGTHAEAVQGMVLEPGGSISGAVIESGRPVILADAREDPRAYRPMVEAGEMGPAMFVPLSASGKAFGTLALSNAPGRRAFEEADLGLVQAFAAQASVAIQYGRAQQDLRRLVVMEDRERIAKELHDGVIQALFAVGMGLQAAATVSASPELRDRLESAVGDLDRVIRDLRNYIFGLRPGILADRQLDQALRRLAAELEEHSGVTIAVDIDPEAAADLGNAPDVIQLVREALSNVSRHSGAVTCRLSLRRSKDGGVVLEVDDDGRGFDVDAAAGSGQGLGNLRDRAGAIGGELRIESSASEGTTIRLTVPL